jgi:hypothetical protein
VRHFAPAASGKRNVSTGVLPRRPESLRNSNSGSGDGSHPPHAMSAGCFTACPEGNLPHRRVRIFRRARTYTGLTACKLTGTIHATTANPSPSRASQMRRTVWRRPRRERSSVVSIGLRAGPANPRSTATPTDVPANCSLQRSDPP